MADMPSAHILYLDHASEKVLLDQCDGCQLALAMMGLGLLAQLLHCVMMQEHAATQDLQLEALEPTAHPAAFDELAPGRLVHKLQLLVVPLWLWP